MITAVWTHLQIFINSNFQSLYIFVFKCCILVKPVVGGVDGSLQLPLRSMNRLNQTEPATFSILTWWAFFRNSIFLYFIVTTVLFVSCRGRKNSPRTCNQDVVQVLSILEDRSARYNCCVYIFMVFLLSSIWLFLLGWFQYSLIEYCKSIITFRIIMWPAFLNFPSWCHIRDMQASYLWSPFHIPLCLVPHIIYLLSYSKLIQSLNKFYFTVFNLPICIFWICNIFMLF
jgi:hypothetical protein